MEKVHATLLQIVLACNTTALCRIVLHCRMIVTTYLVCLGAGFNFGGGFGTPAAGTASSSSFGITSTPGFGGLAPTAGFGAGLTVGTSRATVSTRKPGAKHKK